MSKIPHGEPYAGKLHVRFDEGADVPCGGVSPYSTPQWWSKSGGLEVFGWLFRKHKAEVMEDDKDN